MALSVNLVAPDRRLWRGDALSVSAPSVEGSIGLLPGHEPILSVLGAGSIKVVEVGGEVRLFAISSGFISLDHDVVTIVVEPTTTA